MIFPSRIAPLKNAAAVLFVVSVVLGGVPHGAKAEQAPCRFLCDEDQPQGQPAPPTPPAPMPPQPVPTPTPAPRQPAPPVNQGSCVRDVMSNDVLWIRKGPGVQFDKVAAIPYNACGVVIDRRQCSGVWCPVEFNGNAGWSNSRYLD